MRHNVLLAFALVGPVGLDAAAQERPRGTAAAGAKVSDELKPLQGKWKLVRVDEKGPGPFPSPEDAVKEEIELLIQGDIVTHIRKGKVTLNRDRITVNTKTDPKEVDFVAIDGKGDRLKIEKRKPSAKGSAEIIAVEDAEARLSIYQVKDDTLMVAGDRRGGRPKSFELVKVSTSEVVVTTFKRVKE
jgi:uncharacterized protein (TIGR03067 family)